MEREHMRKLKSGSGLLGTTRINLAEQKQQVCGLTKDINLGHNNEILHKLHADGIYIDDPEVNSKFTDINI
jgi:hypothetical protein